MELKYKVDKKSIYKNVRQVLKMEFNMSNRLITKSRQNKSIYVNDNETYLDKQLMIGDVVKCKINFIENSENIISVKMNLNILYEDEYLLVVDKPKNTPVHPSILHYNDSLSNGIKYYFNSIGLKRKIRPINRLDKDTTGIVIFAKNEYIQEHLIKQMNSKTFHKEYLAILEGIVTEKSGSIIAPISRKEGSIIERCINPNGSKAISYYNVLGIEKNRNISFVKFIIETGRTHQIRLHSQYIGHPIIGDTLYGHESTLINRQALHCYKITFIHPITNIKVELISPIPNDMLKKSPLWDIK